MNMNHLLAQNAQAELIRKQRELDDAKRELDLTVETRVQESLGAVRLRAKHDAEEELKLKISEREEKRLLNDQCLIACGL